MSVPDSEINPPNPGPEELRCEECREEYHVNDLVDGICPKCQPCGECGGEGCEECIDEVPKLRRAGTEVAMDKAAEAVSKLHPAASKHLIREAIAAHMNPEVKKLNDAIVGLVVISTNAVAEYAIATKASLGQGEIKQLKNTIAGLAATQTFMFAKFLSGMETETELAELKAEHQDILKGVLADKLNAQREVIDLKALGRKYQNKMQLKNQLYCKHCGKAVPGENCENPECLAYRMRKACEK